MRDVKVAGFDPRNPARAMSIRAVPEMWRSENIVPYDEYQRAVNERLMDAYYDFYLLNSPDGWDEWHDSSESFGRDERPTDAEWESAQLDFFQAVRDIDVYSAYGRDLVPTFTRPLVWDSVKDAIPGYRDWESVVEPAYRERMNGTYKVPPVLRNEWLRSHPLEDYLPDDDPEPGVGDEVPEPEPLPSVGFDLGGMCLSRPVAPVRRTPDFEERALLKASTRPERSRMADVALEAEEMRDAHREALEDMIDAKVRELDSEAESEFGDYGA